MKLTRLGNWMLGFGLLGWALCTYVTTFVIKALFTPPVSFGTNCEPAAAWSMNKLIWTQFIGILCFMAVGMFFDLYLRRRAKKSQLSGVSQSAS